MTAYVNQHVMQTLGAEFVIDTQCSVVKRIHCMLQIRIFGVFSDSMQQSN